jgi:branched-chain amino acid transport system ATP-binding protein
MSLTTLAQAIVAGLASGALDALLALPFAIVFGLGRVLNLAHGELVVLGGYVAYTAWHAWGWPLPALAPLAGVALVPLGLPWRALLARIPAPVELRGLTLTFGLSLLRAPTARALVEQLFPVLAARPDASVQQLSAGEQQMVALGRALMATPRCLVLDDPFLGLAPALRDLAAGRGLAILAAGQHVRTLLRVAHRAYVLDAGRVVVTGPGRVLLEHPDVRRTLLDLGRGESP